MYRQIDTGTWDDPWFAELEPDAKLVFLYMLTNRRSTAAGVFEITIRAMAFETGLTPKRVGEVLELISSRVRWWPEYQTIWVRNFLRHQAPSPNLFKSAWNEMLDAPGVIRDEVGETYPLLTDENPPPEKKEDIQTLMEGYAKGSQRVPDGSRKTSLVKSSTSLEEDSSLVNGASAPKKTQSPKKPKRATQVPDDFAVTDALISWANSSDEQFTVPEMQSQVPRFVAHHKAKGTTYKDWHAAFQNWMRNALDFGHLNRTPDGALRVHRGGKPDVQSQNDAAFAEVERELYGTSDDDAIDTQWRQTS